MTSEVSWTRREGYLKGNESISKLQDWVGVQLVKSCKRHRWVLPKGRPLRGTAMDGRLLNHGTDIHIDTDYRGLHRGKFAGTTYVRNNHAKN